MTDTTPSALSVVYGAFDGNRLSPSLSPTDAATTTTLSLTLPPTMLLPSKTSDPSSDRPSGSPDVSGKSLCGKVRMNPVTLRGLREARYLSQQELVNDFERGNFRVSIATIKRAETGHDVRFRICRELARYFGVSFEDLLR
jgi:hypothetical protein